MAYRPGALLRDPSNPHRIMLHKITMLKHTERDKIVTRVSVGENGLDVVSESHVEHAVHLVQYDVTQL